MTIWHLILIIPRMKLQVRQNTEPTIFWLSSLFPMENMGYGPRSPKLNPAVLNVHLLECKPDHPVSLQKRGLQFFQVQNQYPLCSSDVYCKFIVRVLLVLSFFDLLSYHRMLFLPNLILVLSSVFSDSSVLLFYQLLISSLCL